MSERVKFRVVHVVQQQRAWTYGADRVAGELSPCAFAFMLTEDQLQDLSREELDRRILEALADLWRESTYRAASLDNVANMAEHFRRFRRGRWTEYRLMIDWTGSLQPADLHARGLSRFVDETIPHNPNPGRPDPLRSIPSARLYSWALSPEFTAPVSDVPRIQADA